MARAGWLVCRLVHAPVILLAAPCSSPLALSLCSRPRCRCLCRCRCWQTDSMLEVHPQPRHACTWPDRAWPASAPPCLVCLCRLTPQRQWIDAGELADGPDCSEEEEEEEEEEGSAADARGVYYMEKFGCKARAGGVRHGLARGGRCGLGGQGSSWRIATSHNTGYLCVPAATVVVRWLAGRAYEDRPGLPAAMLHMSMCALPNPAGVGPAGELNER